MFYYNQDMEAIMAFRKGVCDDFATSTTYIIKRFLGLDDKQQNLTETFIAIMQNNDTVISLAKFIHNCFDKRKCYITCK